MQRKEPTGTSAGEAAAQRKSAVIHSVGHAGAVLDLFSLEQPEWGASKVARALRISKSAAHDMLLSLASIGLLRRVAQGRYRLGWRALALAHVIASTDELVGAAKPVMRELARALGGPVALATGPSGEVVALTDERGTSVGGCTWFPRAALVAALLANDRLVGPVVSRAGAACHVAAEIPYDGPAPRLALGASIPPAAIDRSAWVAETAVEVGRRLQRVWPENEIRQRPVTDSGRSHPCPRRRPAAILWQSALRQPGEPPFGSAERRLDDPPA